MSDLCKERILSEHYRDFIVTRVRPPFFRQISEEQLCEQKMDFGYSAAYLQETLATPITFEKFSYNSIPSCYTLLDMDALNQSGILSIQNYPTLQLKGENVIIGFVDTGIDYQNPIFRNLDGSTRILGIWDQTIQSGFTPQGIDYGSEYTENLINEALASETPQTLVPTVDENGHGTFLASVAAGGADAQNQFLGAAPECRIAMVKLKPAKHYLKQYYYIEDDVLCYQENDIMLGLHYLENLANAYQMPLVFCVALGTNMGGHDGSLPLPFVLNQYAGEGNRAVVIGGGNEAGARHHYEGNLTNMNQSENVEIRVEQGVSGFSMELWTEIPNILSVTVTSPSGESTSNLSIRSSSSQMFQFLFEGTSLFVDYRLLVERSSSELVFFRFAKPTPGIWRITVTPVQIATGEFHMWLPVTEFLSGTVYFIRSSPNKTITNPANSQDPLTVAFYNGEEDSIALESGRGYTRKNLIKPELAAPGVNILGATTRQNFTRRSGSSLAAGITAGAMALLMEWVIYHRGDTGIDSVQLKSMLILGAERKNNISYPNREWGYGTLDLYRTFEETRQF
ncbi:MAG: S8 family peptidase [Hespellia sp.]|nr:S8 family peptidase [Hespellia sp.]